MNIGTVYYAAMRGNTADILSRAAKGTDKFHAILAGKDSVKTAGHNRTAANALWGRTAAGIDARLVNYVSANKHCTFDEFTNFYEAGLKAKGLSKINYAELVKGATGFSDVFLDYKVITKVGNCNVSAANWQRNDFPFCKFFQEGTQADALND